MSSANESAFPTPEILTGSGSVWRAVETGLTKREYFAAMAMQGWLAGVKRVDVIPFPAIAQWAVGQADALLAELSK